MALHPAMTFTGTLMDVDRLRDCAFGVTAPDPLREMAMALVLDMGGTPVWIAEADRVTYHAALAHGANHLVTLIAEAAQVLRAAGVAQTADVLGPLVRAALDNALRLGDVQHRCGGVARRADGTEQVPAVPVRWLASFASFWGTNFPAGSTRSQNSRVDRRSRIFPLGLSCTTNPATSNPTT